MHVYALAEKQVSWFGDWYSEKKKNESYQKPKNLNQFLFTQFKEEPLQLEDSIPLQ